MCHIDATDIAPPQTSYSRVNSGASARWLRCATQVVNAASRGRPTMPAEDTPEYSAGSSGSARSFGSTTPTQSIAPSESTCTQRFSRPVSQARPFEREQRHHAPDHDVGQRGGQLLSHSGAAVRLLG